MRLTLPLALVTVFLVMAGPRLVAPLSAAPTAPSAVTRAAGQAPSSQVDAAIRRSVQAYWNHRQAKDLAGMYAFYSASYRARVPREAYLQQTRLVRFDLSDASIGHVDVVGERATVAVSYRLRLPTLSVAPVTASMTETWIREGRQWRKLDEPLDLPFPQALPAGTDVEMHAEPHGDPR